VHSVWQALDGDTANPWRHDTFNGHSHGKKYGVVCDLYRRVVSPPVHAMPPWLQAVMQRMRDTRPPLGLMQHKVGQPQPLADETRVANRNVSGFVGRSLTRPFRDARRFPSTRL
jgi:hypothetical protein